jgi:glycosyltransferase involved in cell wall biosynthesis
MLIKGNKRTKLLFVVNYIPHYRLSFFELLGDFYELTIVHCGEKNKVILNFTEIVLKKISVFNLSFYRTNILKLAKNHDVVICLADLKVPQCILLGFNPFRNYKLIFWGIGVSASYNKRFDYDKKFDFLRYKLLNRADALIFYSEYPIKKYMNLGCSLNKLFVANNTIFVKERITVKHKKECLLFVGTLYRQKGIYDLLQAYLVVQNEFSQMPQLIIVGDGPEKSSIEDWIIKKKMSGRIILKGEVIKTEKLREIYSNSIVCISPNQAGLSVLASMAHGVPFVTSKEAITGGEIFNIKNMENGILYDGTENGLVDSIKYILENPDKILKMSYYAQEYYFANRNMELMVGGFRQAIQFALK